jgi:hypothetical protein
VVEALGVGGLEFYFASADQISRQYGVRVDINDLFLGKTDPPGGSGSNITVTLSDATGAASSVPPGEMAVTTAHELYGHALPLAEGKPWKHDDGGSVDMRIREIHSRTRDPR